MTIPYAPAGRSRPMVVCCTCGWSSERSSPQWLWKDAQAHLDQIGPAEAAPTD